MIPINAETKSIMTVFMKKIGFILLASIWIIPSCTKQQENTTGSGAKVYKLTASVDETKTTIGKDGSVYKIYWATGDKISVNGQESDPVSSADNGKKSVNFSVTLGETGPYKVLYPATTSQNVVSLPATQNYVAGSFDPAAAPMYGNAVKTGAGECSVKLSNFCGMLRFALKGSATLDRIELKSKGGEKLCGDFTLAIDANGFTGAFSGGSASTLTVDLDDLALGAEDTPIYVPIPAQAYSAGLEALVYQADGAFMRLTFWGDGATLTGADIAEFGSKTYAAGRVEEIFAINGLVAENGGAPTAAPPSITIATYNVMRLDDDNRPAAATTGDSNGKIARPENAIVKDCSEMKVALGQAIYNTAADIIGFQEIGDDMYASGQTYSLEDIAAAQSAAYTWKLNFPGSESGNYHYCNGFAYKSSILTLNDSGKAWLRTNSNSYSTSSASNSGDPNRYVVWGLFTHKVSGKQFYFFVTQLPTYSQDGGSGTSNLNMAGGVNAFAASKTAVNRRILVGDMNAATGSSAEAGYNKLKEYWSDSYEAVNAAGNLASFYQTYSGTQSGTGLNYLYSILQFCKNHPERRIDHIMTQGACTATSYKTIRTTYSFGTGDDAVDCAPSDHLPVVCTITLD